MKEVPLASERESEQEAGGYKVMGNMDSVGGWYRMRRCPSQIGVSVVVDRAKKHANNRKEYIYGRCGGFRAYPFNVSVNRCVSPSISKILIVLSDEHVASRRP